MSPSLISSRANITRNVETPDWHFCVDIQFGTHIFLKEVTFLSSWELLYVQPRSDACRESDHKSCLDRAGAEGLPALLVAVPVSEWAPSGLPVQRQQALLLWHVAFQEVHSRCITLLCTSSPLP